jgi:hypothetical protein
MGMYLVYLTHFSLVTIIMATVTLYVSSMFAFRVSVGTFPTTYTITTQVPYIIPTHVPYIIPTHVTYIIPTHVPVSNIILFHIVCIVLFVILSTVFLKGRSRIFSLLWASRNVTIKRGQYRVIDVGVTPLWHLTFLLCVTLRWSFGFTCDSDVFC